MANDVSSPRRDTLQEADGLLLDRYAPASIVIDADLQILQFRGRTSPYLEPASGKASLSLLKLVHQDLVLDLRRAIYAARKSGQLVKQEGILVTSGDTQRLVTMNVHPLPAPSTTGIYLIVFAEKAAAPSQPSAPAPPAEEGAEVVRSDCAPDRLAALERDLVVTRNEMHAMIKEQEAINEELQSANQEALSSNEELQSINEELETSKEEIETSNEELQAANQALQARGEQLKEMGEYTNAIVETIREPLVVLNSALHVQRANAAFYQIFRQVIVQIQAGADMVTLSVQDFGMGIPTDEQEHVFERFFRVGQSRWGMVPGLGLGLCISSEIIKRLGGRML